MAVQVPTTIRSCLNCKINSDANAEKDFHEIFDEVGLELQLPFLVKTFFRIDLNQRDKQHLCETCVNRLIELYDLDEHAKQESCNTNNLKIIQYDTQVNIPKSNSIEYTNFKTFVSTQGENTIEINKQDKSENRNRTEYENIKDEGYFFNKSRSAALIQQQNQNSNDVAEYFPKEDFDQNGEREVSQDFNTSLSSGAINHKKSDELELNEHIEFIIDNGIQNVKINKQSNTDIMDNVFEEVDETVKSYIPNKIQTKNKCQEDLHAEVVDDRSNQVANSDDSNSLLEELKITEDNKASLLNEEISKETYSLEEEYLIEETILSEEYDPVDLNEYLDKVLITKFQDLMCNWEMECKWCLEKYYTFGELLNHACMAEFEKMKKVSCIVKDCEEHAKDLPTLARHLVLKHYDKLESQYFFPTKSGLSCVTHLTQPKFAEHFRKAKGNMYSKFKGCRFSGFINIRCLLLFFYRISKKGITYELSFFFTLK